MTDLEPSHGLPPEFGVQPDHDVDATAPHRTATAIAAPPAAEPMDATPARSPEDGLAVDDGLEVGETADGSESGAGHGPVEAATDELQEPTVEGTAAAARGRRRRIALLILLAMIATAMLLFAGWYLMTRKPISELPLPGLTVDAVPHYEFSVYGVTAPTGVAVTADGSRIYVTQTEGDPSVLVFDGKGAPLGTLEAPAATGSSHVPVYVAINPTNGDVYVSDRPTASILVFDAGGTFRQVFQPGKSLAGWQPLGLGFDRAGNLFVTDVSGPFNTVHEFAPNGTLVRTIGDAGMFNFPNGVAVDTAGNLYVTDSNNGRLVVFDPSGRQRAIVRRGSAAGDLGLPRGAAIDDMGRVYVVDTSAQGVQLYHVMGAEDAPPAFIGRFGATGSDDGAFQYPNGVAVDGRARVYVTDWRNNRVQVWTY
jgi:DNA-binding beta-propeller fold protein YncE